jgi:hypothetical protein
VATFWNQVEAHQARLVLEQEDIPCGVTDENTAAWFPHLVGAIGGIKLRVREDDYRRARSVLAQAGLVEADEGEPDETDDGPDG